MNQTATLTRRETEIAELIAWGATKKEIANHLFRSPRTIENTARSIYEKTGVTKANELSAWWFCTHFNISFNLSPLKRSVVSIFFLLLFIPFEFTTHQEALRSVRGRIAECREKEVKGIEDPNTFTLEF